MSGAAVAAPSSPLTPDLYRVVARRRETVDVVTLRLAPAAGRAPSFRAGQFNMLTAFGVGEVPISISSPPGRDGPIDHTVRAVGAVTEALCAADVGAVVGVRGPYGTDWGTDRVVAGRDACVVIAGGIGLAPLRGAVARMVGDAARVVVLVGARSPDQLIFGDDLDAWRDAGAEVAVTVDVADPSWTGNVGVVTTLLTRLELDPARTVALLCGPEVMMRFTARALLDKGLAPGRVLVSLERNMQCGVALCGHCQLGPLLLCRDGPVVPYDEASALLAARER